MGGAQAVIAAPPTPPPPPGAIGPINPAILSPQRAFNHARVQEGFTVYIDESGQTITGAVPYDAIRGFTPAAHGPSYGIPIPVPNCIADIPDQSVQDHATFTPEQLAKYGLPTEQFLGIPHDEWVTMVRAAKHRVCSGRATYEDGHPLHMSTLPKAQVVAAQAPLAPHTPARTLDTCINYCGPDADITTNPPGTNCPGTTVFLCVDRSTHYSATGASYGAWAGFGTDRINCQWGYAACPPLTEVVSYWHVPVITQRGTNTLDDSVAWVGVGGVHYNPNTVGNCNNVAGSPSLVQIGTRSYHFSTDVNGNLITRYEFWVENCSSNIGSAITLGSTNPGDLVVGYAGSSSSSYPGYTYYQDYTTGLVWSANAGPGGVGITTWPGPDQGTAECLAEALAHPSQWEGLANWGDSLHFEACRAWTSYNTSTIMGLGSMPGDDMLNFRYYVTDGSEYYCTSTQWWDSYDATYGYTSYYNHWAAQDPNC